ncbi:MAG: hypothetical protein M3P33_02405 [bacterium]|nr:hypothetical protein [bacterium]
MKIYCGVTVLSQKEFLFRINEIGKLTDGIHIDFGDGKFVDNKTLSVNDLELPKHVFCEAHLMIEEPEKYLNLYSERGFEKVIVHLEALKKPDFIYALEIQNQVHSLGMKFGLTWSPKLNVEYSDDLKLFDSVTVMTVVPGYSHGAFISEQLNVIKSLRSHYPEIVIEVDGHVNDITIKEIHAAGASEVVSTSYLSGEDMEDKYLLLKNG